MRNLYLEEGEYYHIYNRGNDKKDIFSSDRDYARFLFLILYFQAELSFYNIDRYVNRFLKSGDFGVDNKTVKNILKNRYVEVISFCLMPNHFHVLVKNIEKDGISKYMHRIGVSYTKFFNLKYGKSGHLFQGSFKSVHVEDNEHLLYLSAYIHRNPRELKGWKNKEYVYNWSSFKHYLNTEDKEILISKDIILDQFDSIKDYCKYVDTSIAKE